MFKTANYCYALALFGVTLSGCHLKPDWGPPGTIGQQRDRAELHDPFPDNDLGPAISRPLGFDRPTSEAKRLQTSPYARRSMNGGPVTPYNGF